MTFGSFNNFAKVSDRTLALWGRVLEAVPNSRLLLKSYTTTDLAFHARLLRCGLDSKRVELLTPAASNAAHLRLYNEVDVALDTYPYHGTTTTCEALWMQRPVITLAGNTHAGRVGVSLLQAVGLPELIAKTPDDYISLAAGLAQDGARLAELRASVRDRMAGSALCDGKAFAAKFESALRMMWREWCRA